jgi:hypothetical protein
MDELELRRRLLADPQARDPQLQQQLQQSPASQRYQQELLTMEQQLKQSVQLHVPSDLADRLLLAQGIVNFSESQQQKRRFWLGLAAAVLCIGLISPTLYQKWVWSDNLADHALAHVYHEAAYLVDQTTEVPIAQVNQLLADFNAELNNWPGAIRYARYCDFQGHRSLHLILQTPSGLLTVFVMPPQHGLPGGEQFADQNFHGQSMQLGPHSLVLVAGNQQALQPFAEELQQHIRWQI